ncbi:MAG: substrate-binding domain-containing protein [Anaerolineae bacterium]|nr:substrate-binding domain-containing protein [Phycisphaerae bacterium]
MAPPFDSFWSDVLYGIHDALSDADHVPMMVWTSHEGRHRRKGPLPSPEHELRQIHRLLDRRIDGVILWPPFAAYYKDHVQEFSSRDLPIVTIDHELPPEFNADCVSSDEQAGTRAVAKHLYDLGHRRFGHLSGIQNASWAIDRRRGFEQTLAAYRDASCISFEALPEEDESAILPARQMLSRPNRPTAVFAATDILAKKVYEAAAELKLRVPQDLSVVGFADDDFSAEMIPPLTTVRQNGYDIGRKAADIVLERSNGMLQDASPVHTRMPVELIARKSTGRAPIGQ